jgi:hypothetical protein
LLLLSLLLLLLLPELLLPGLLLVPVAVVVLLLLLLQLLLPELALVPVAMALLPALPSSARVRVPSDALPCGTCPGFPLRLGLRSAASTSHCAAGSLEGSRVGTACCASPGPPSVRRSARQSGGRPSSGKLLAGNRPCV